VEVRVVGTQVGMKAPVMELPGIEEVQARISHSFARSEVKQSSQFYLKSLLDQVERKNCWQLAEAAGEENPYGIQRLLCKARWDADVVRDDLRAYVMEYFQDPSAIGVIDETGFIKQGQKSVGVQRQYSGTAGKIDNCQIGVFLNYVAPKGKAFIDRELYLPQQWAVDQVRRKEAGVPEKIQFATKPELARSMLQRALEAGVFFSWITADTVYGNCFQLRHWLEKEKQPYVLAISSYRCIWGQDMTKRRIKKLAAEISDDDWQRLSAGEGTKGLRIYDWVWLKLPDVGEAPPAGWNRWLLVRRSIEKPEEIAYYLAAGPENTTLVTLAEVAGKRWSVEISFEEAKGEAGLDEYEVRKWESWYRHITLSLLAHAYLAVCRLYGKEKGAMIS